MTGRRKGLRITCYGDSLIQGFPFTEEHSWVAAAGRGSAGTWENHGICGECCDDITERVLRQRWDGGRLLLYEGGMNDIIQGVPLSFSLEQMERARRHAAAAGAAAVFVLPWYCAAAELNPLVRRLRAAMRERFPRGTVLGGAAPAKGAEAADLETGRTAEPPVWFLDFEPVFPPGGEAELAALRRKYFIWGGVHPTADTYELLGKYAGQVFAGL